MKRFISIILALFLISVCAAAETAGTKLNPFEYTGDDPYTAAICEWLLGTKAEMYAPGEVAIPCPVILEVDDSDPEDILVWGSFNLNWYELRNTTLFCVSGGNHPGLIHLSKTGGSYAVADFEAVGDGTDYSVDIERIFGMREGLLARFENSYAEAEAVRLEFAGMYASANDARINQMQDFGWLPIALPGASEIYEEDQLVIHTSSMGYRIEYDLRQFSYSAFDENYDYFSGVDVLEGISISIQRYDEPAESVISSIVGSMEEPVQENVTVGAEAVPAILVRDAALSDEVHKNNYIVEMDGYCLVIKTSNTYYAAVDASVVEGADEAIEAVLATLIIGK